MRNTHSSFKHFPVGSQYMSFACSIAVTYHTTKHASHISRTFFVNLSLYFTFPATPSTSMVAKCAAINADEVDFICTSAFAISAYSLQLQSPNSLTHHHSSAYQVLIVSSNLSPYSSPNHIPSLLCLSHI